MAVPASNSAQACLEGSFTPMSEATRLPDSASYPVYDPPLSRMPAPGHLPAALSLSSLRNPLPLLPRGERYLGVEIELMLTDKSLEATSMLLKLIGYPHGGVRAWKTGYRVNDGLRALIAIALGQPEEVVSKGEQTYQEWAVKLDGSISVPRSSCEYNIASKLPLRHIYERLISPNLTGTIEFRRPPGAVSIADVDQWVAFVKAFLSGTLTPGAFNTTRGMRVGTTTLQGLRSFLRPQSSRDLAAIGVKSM